jgi:hypothetical protein
MRKRKGALLRISIEIETTKKSLFYLLAQSVSVYPTSNVGTLVKGGFKMMRAPGLQLALPSTNANANFVTSRSHTC